MMPSAPPSRMTGLRRFGLFSTLGALLGFIGFCMIGPRLIGVWYAPSGTEALVCGTEIGTAMAGFVRLQLWAAVAGALFLLGLVTSLRSLWFYLFHPRAADPTPANPQPYDPSLSAPTPLPGTALPPLPSDGNPLAAPDAPPGPDPSKPSTL